MGDLTAREPFRALFERVSNWGRWGPEDERGTLNLIGPEQRAAAARLVSEGFPVSCARALMTEPGADNPEPTKHLMVRGGDAEPMFMAPEPLLFTADYFALAPHGLTTTHLDALCHCSVDGKIYNGYETRDAVRSTGARKDSIMIGADGIISRGVLLDFPALLGLPWLEPGFAIRKGMIEEAEKRQGVTVASGDVLLVGTGRVERAAVHPWTPADGLAGLHPECMDLLHDRDIAVLGCDGISDASPPAVDAWRTPVHQLALCAMGTQLIDNMDLSRLATACRERNRYAFQLTIAPLRLERGTASPVNPIALF